MRRGGRLVRRGAPIVLQRSLVLDLGFGQAAESSQVAGPADVHPPRRRGRAVRSRLFQQGQRPLMLPTPMAGFGGALPQHGHVDIDRFATTQLPGQLQGVRPMVESLGQPVQPFSVLSGCHGGLERAGPLAGQPPVIGQACVLQPPAGPGRQRFGVPPVQPDPLARQQAGLQHFLDQSVVEPVPLLSRHQDPLVHRGPDGLDQRHLLKVHNPCQQLVLHRFHRGGQRAHHGSRR